MNNNLASFRNQLFEQYIQFSYRSPKLNNKLVSTLRILTAFRNLAYIFEKQYQSYTYILSVIGRPHIVIFVENIQYVMLGMCVIYLLLSQIKYPLIQIISPFGQLIRVGLINFFFEVSRGNLDYLAQISLIFINIFDFFILNGTLNVGSETIFTPKKSLLDFIIILINILIMYLSKFNVNKVIITLIAIANSVLTLFHLIFWFPIKSLNINTILISIHMLTIYLGIVQILIGEHNFLIDFIVWTFIMRIVYSQLCIQVRYPPTTLPDLLYKVYDKSILKSLILEKPKPEEKQDLIIYASLLALQCKYYEGLMVLHSIKKLNWLAQIKKQILIKDWLQKMDTTLKNSSQAQSGLSEAVEQLTILEDQNVTIQTKIINIIRNKYQLMYSISQKQKVQFSDLIQFLDQVIAIQNSLEKQYKVFPNQKTQNILSFLYSEVLNEFMLASQLKTHLTQNDDKSNISVFTNKMVYLISQFNNNEVLIKRASNNASALFKINHHELIKRNIDLIIPPGIREQHEKLIKKFLLNGQSKFMRRLDINYFHNNKGFMQAVEFAIDISFTSEEINFITFMQPFLEQPMTMVVNSSHVISSITETILSGLNLSQSSSFIGERICKFLPILKNIPYSQYYESVDFIVFPYKDEVTSTSTTTYTTSFEVETKIIEQEVLFFIIRFDYFKKSDNSIKFTHTETNNSLIKGSFSISENVFVDDPYKSDNEIIVCAFSNLIVVSKQTNEIFDQTVHQTQIKDNQLSSRPLFYHTNNKIEYSISVEEDKFYLENPKMQSMMDNAEQSSRLSSIRGFRQSVYYKKYEIMNKIHEITGLTVNHKFFLFFFALCLLVQLAFVITQFRDTDVSLTNLISDIDLLQIKNFAFQPFESFLVTRWTIFNYNNLLAANLITKQDFNQLVLFPRSNLPLGFDRLQQNMDEVLNKLELQQFLENTYLDIQLYTTTNIGEHYTVALRNCMMIMLNYEYWTKMAYQLDGNVNTDSTYIYYQYRNYYTIKTEFGLLNKDLLDTTITRSETILFELEAIYIMSLMFLFFSLFFNFLLYLRIERSIRNFVNLVFCCQVEFFTKDLNRLATLQTLIINDYNNLFSYTFALDLKEQYFDKMKKKLERNDHKKFIFENNEFLSVRNYSNRIFFVIILVTVLTQASVSYGQVKNYLSKYPATAKFYKDISDIGTDVPCVYAQSNILYGRATFPYYNADDIAKVFEEIINAKYEINNFTQSTIDFNQYFLSSSFSDKYNSIMNTDLCSQLTAEMQEKSKNICSLVMEQQMKRGLLAILIYIVNYIQTEQDINQFTKRLQLSYLELEGAFLASEIVRTLNLELQTDLSIQTGQLINQITMHSIAIMIVICLFALFLNICLKKTLVQRQLVVQRMLYLVPLQTLLFDDGFERNAKTIILREKF